ncbi:MAG TPA: hypothetical protein VMF69_04755 [Gemmataceae bacterium]|nr:hypothetical protein [Gemmataceae bacterium]
MDEKENTNRSLATDGTPRCHRRRLFMLAGAAGAVLVLLLACLFGAWLLRGWRGDDDLGNRVPPGILAEYVPEDSEAVLAVNIRQMLETPVGRQHLGPFLQQLIEKNGRQLPWLELAGIKSIEDIDSILISFSPGVGGGPVWLARGRFDRSHFQIGSDKLQEKILDRFRVWEHNDRLLKRITLLAPVGNMLVASETPGRVQSALRQASNPQPIHVRDAVLRELLSKVDRRQSLWLAASIRSLGPISNIDNYLLKMVLRPLLSHSESVDGGISCGEDLRAELHFSTATDEDAVQLEMDLKCLCEAAPGAALLGQQNELLPLLRFLGNGQIHRDGKLILLHCRLTADQGEK